MTLASKLAQFTGTEKYTSFNPFTHLLFTDGAVFFHEQSSLLLDVAIAATYEPDLRNEEFLSITINVGNDGAKTIVTDGDSNEVLYCQHDDSCDLEHGNYKFFVTNNVLMLTSEY